MIYDVAVIGAGIAGASLAAELSSSLSVLILEREDQPGYHSTGRSAAFWDECYGGLDVQPLTSASKDFLQNPPTHFSERGFLQERGVLYLGQQQDQVIMQDFVSEFARRGVRLALEDRTSLLARVDGLKQGWDIGIFGPDCCDIDVSGLHTAYLRQSKKKGHHLALRSPVSALSYKKSHWAITTPTATFQASIIVNAAGAWADVVAEMAGVAPLGHTPYRRTVAQVRLSTPIHPTTPLVIDFDGGFYFKPAGDGRIWLSPHDETPSSPHDVAPEELDVALGIDRLSMALDVTIEAVEKKWAGLRTFAPDRLPVYGYDEEVPSFFWCTGQGGYGIQTAPAAAQLCAALLERGSLPVGLEKIDPVVFGPGRFAI
jgi:D-arginine dehydrogenase